MMIEKVMDLVAAVDERDRERAYQALARMGVDRATADKMAAEFYGKECNDEIKKATNH